MKSRRLLLPYSVLFTAVVLIALGQSAFADGTESTHVARLLSTGEPDAALALPGSLNAWKDAADQIELPEAPIVSFSEFPQGRLAQKDPFIDFSKWEVGAFLGLVDYSSAFKAKVDLSFGIDTRIPVPGIPLGEWGVWGEFFVGHITRDIPFYYPKRQGDWYGIAVGGDYTFLRTDLVFLRAQGGIMYAQWNNIHALDNGAGVLVGAEFGWYWIKHYSRASLTLNPQLNFDSKNWVGLIDFGFSYEF